MSSMSGDFDLAAGKGAGARVSMQNVAAYAGVSIATVSKVMQGVSTVLPDNVTRVQNAIEAWATASIRLAPNSVAGAGTLSA